MDKIKERYNRAFAGESDYIPLLVKVPGRDEKLWSCIECMNEPEKVIENYEIQHANMKGLKSDYVPFIESNFLENLVPSFFGAVTHIAPGGLVDVKPPFTSVLELGDLEAYKVGGEILDKAMSHLKRLIEIAPENVHVETTRFMSPLDYAVILCGGNFYMELLLYPEACKAFMHKIVDLTIETYKMMKDIIKQPYNETVTIRGAWFPGIRLTGDAIVNLSPKQIEEYLLPLFKRFKEESDHMMLHYCCTPAPSGHVLKAMLGFDSVMAVDNWQGYPTFFTNNEDAISQDQIAICTDLGMDDVQDLEALFSTKLFQVNRKQGRGLTVTVNAPDELSGAKLYNQWQAYQNL